jgi:hypothetical protein
MLTAYPIIDTVLNFLVFGFIGAMVYVYANTSPPSDDD